MTDDKSPPISLKALQRSNRGIGCPACGGKLSRVDRTWDASDNKRRVRICSHCGNRFYTAEVPLGRLGRLDKRTKLNP